MLECGATHVAVGRFARSRGKVRLDEFAREDCTVPTANDAAWREQIGSALHALVRRGIARGPVVVVLPPHLVLTKFIKAPRLPAAKRAKIVAFEAQQNIPFALSDVVWGYAVTGENDSGQDIMLAAAKLDAVEALCRTVEAAGFTPRSVVPAPLALVAAFRAAEPRPSAPTLVIDIGARSTTLLFADGRQAFVRSVNLGGVAAEAENPTTRPGDSAAPSVEAFATRLAQEITRSALHFSHHAGAASPERVLLTGGASRARGLNELLAAKLNLPVARFDPLGAVAVGRTAVAGTAQHIDSLATLIGAALLRPSLEDREIELAPPRLRAREAARRCRPWLAAAAGLVVVALAPPLLHFRALENELRAQVAAVDAEVAMLRAREAANRANLERLARLEREIALWQSLHDRRASWRTLLADLEDRLGRVGDVWLERMQVMPGADADAPLRLAVSGRLLDRTNPLANVSPDTSRRVAELLARLAESPFVSAVEHERFDPGQPGVLRFDVVLISQPARPL